MSRRNRMRQALLSRITLVAALVCAPALAQSPHPTAVQELQLSAFGGASGDYTGLAGGKNLSLTAGADLALPPVYHMRPTLEFRGTYPVDDGHIDSQRDVLGGPRVDFYLGHRLHPYGDFLFGRGQMNYGSGYFYQNYEYELTTTWVYSFGGGVDYNLSDHLAVKLDAQYQRWTGAPVSSGTIWATSGTVGVVYIFNFNRHGIH